MFIGMLIWNIPHCVSAGVVNSAWFWTNCAEVVIWSRSLRTCHCYHQPLILNDFRVLSHYVACHRNVVVMMMMKMWNLCKTAVSKSETTSSSDPWQVDLSDSDSDVAPPKGCYFMLINWLVLYRNMPGCFLLKTYYCSAWLSQYRISSNTVRALNTSRVSNISQGSWFTYWSSLTGLHCQRVISVRQSVSWSYQYFGFLISDCQSEPIINLLTNVLIVSTKYTKCCHQLLWLPYGIGQAIIFLPCDFYLSIYLSIYDTSTHDVALVHI